MLDAGQYGFSEQDLIDMRFYCDVTKKTPGELVEGVKAGKDDVEAKRLEICYKFLAQKRSVASVTQLITDLADLSALAKDKAVVVDPGAVIT